MLSDEISDVKKAFVNSFVLIGLGTFFYSLYHIFITLDTFIRPLIWATLVGTCLYPVKHCTTNFLKSWIDRLEKEDRSLSFGLTVLPFQIIKKISNNLSDLLSLYLKWTLYFIISIFLIILLHESPFLLQILVFFLKLFTLKFPNVVFTSNFFLLLTFLYISTLLFLISKNLSKLSLVSIIYWSYFFMFFFNFFGSFQMPFFILFIAALLMIEFFPSKNNLPNNGDKKTIFKLRRSNSLPAIHNHYQFGKIFRSHEIHTINTDKIKTTASSSEKLVSKSFYFVIWFHIIILGFTKTWTLVLAMMVIGIFGLTQLIFKLSQHEKIHGYLIILNNLLLLKLSSQLDFFNQYTDQIFPYPIRNYPKLFHFIDRKIKNFLRDWLDSIVSLFIILFGILLAILISIFIVLQIQSECIYIISMATNVLNGTMQNGLSSFIPLSENFQPTMKKYIDNIYEHGETLIEHRLDDLFESSSSEDLDRFKDQIRTLWRNIYFSYMNHSLSSNTTDATCDNCYSPLSSDLLTRIADRKNKTISGTLDTIWNSLFSFKMVNITTIVNFIHSNLGVFSTLFESVYSLIKNNVFLLISVLNGIVSFLFGSSTIVLNFIISFVIFLSALFYLLSLSKDRYLPMDYLIRVFAPEAAHALSNPDLLSLNGLTEESNIVLAFHVSLEKAISSVFVANLKLALFYGLYTSLTHQFFRLNLIIIPSVLAALFGAIPIISSYWAAVPGVIELVFVRKSNYMGILLFIVHLIPVQFLDTAIYAQIKGAGHPYLTALAIAGGIYCHGFEGAFFGPIVFCCILVAVNLYSVFLAPSKRFELKQTDKLLF